MMGKSHKYSLSEQPDSGLKAYGILCDEEDYRMCWLLNGWGSLGLVRVPDLIISHSRAPVAQSYSCFDSTSEDGVVSYRLLANRSREGVWLSHYSQVNYILLVLSPGEQTVSVLSLKSKSEAGIPEIRGIFELTDLSVLSLL